MTKIHARSFAVTLAVLTSVIFVTFIFATMGAVAHADEGQKGKSGQPRNSKKELSLIDKLLRETVGSASVTLNISSSSSTVLTSSSTPTVVTVSSTTASTSTTTSTSTNDGGMVTPTTPIATPPAASQSVVTTPAPVRSNNMLASFFGGSDNVTVNPYTSDRLSPEATRTLLVYATVFVVLGLLLSGSGTIMRALQG
jgi:hypothetical protein